MFFSISGKNLFLNLSNAAATFSGTVTSPILTKIALWSMNVMKSRPEVILVHPAVKVNAIGYGMSFYHRKQAHSKPDTYPKI